MRIHVLMVYGFRLVLDIFSGFLSAPALDDLGELLFPWTELAELADVYRFKAPIGDAGMNKVEDLFNGTTYQPGIFTREGTYVLQYFFVADLGCAH